MNQFDICSFSQPTKEYGVVDFRVTCEELTEKQLQVTLQVNLKAEKATITFVLDLDVQGRMIIEGLPGTSTFLNCVIACAVGVLVADIMDCWKKDKTVKGLLQCLKSKGYSISASVAGCIASCGVGSL
jgi:hypothetical protein